MITIEIDGHDINSVVVKQDGVQLGKIQDIFINLSSKYPLRAGVHVTPTGGEAAIEALLAHGFVVDKTTFEEGCDPHTELVINGPAGNWYCGECKGYHMMRSNADCTCRPEDTG